MRRPGPWRRPVPSELRPRQNSASRGQPARTSPRVRRRHWRPGSRQPSAAADSAVLGALGTVLREAGAASVRLVPARPSRRSEPPRHGFNILLPFGR
ncbi:hypothetical protein BRADI_1g30835v3 [Brachypodium distachyon]|uniref:Uncharacterized protein n=1 Tax=Brachypodium distachyon TaxID=15368 RepID=A0A2K2DM61_BRADI|nr:hypothetical protein BRADI_1g30835v3 [Brachypodium distachyon]